MGKYFSATAKNMASKTHKGTGIPMRRKKPERSLREKSEDSSCQDTTKTIYSTNKLPSERMVKEQKPLMNDVVNKLQKINITPRVKRKNISFTL